MMLTRRTALISATATLTIGCANAQPSTPSTPRYITTHKPLPFRVQEIYPAAHKGRIHIAGGLLSDGTRVTGVSDQHIAYDPKTGASTTLVKLPAMRHHPHAVSHNGRLYMLGGFGTNPNAVNWIMSTDTLRLDDAANSWTALAPAPEPHAEVVGGRRPKAAANLAYGDHEDVTRHLVYDPAANTWTKAAPALTARNSASGGVINGLWHVAGGRSVANGPTDAHEVYDPKEDRWRNAAPMPKGSGA
ncbi:MAG: galactose oxidase, partial [Lysobacteraceae bacterium]